MIRATLGRRGRLAVLLAALAVVGGALAGCGGSDHLEVEAVFDDALDLVPRHHVRAGDIPIGHVTDLELTDDDRARVTMEVTADSGLPAEVEAVLRQTSLLGERYVELRPLDDAGELAAGKIADTRVVSDVEDLVATGGELVAGVAADRLATAMEVGAVAFGGRGTALGDFVEHMEVFVGRYEEGSEDLTRLIEASDELLTGLAADADAHGEAIAELSRAARALEEEDERLLDAIDDLARASDVGARILAEHRQEFDNLIRRLDLVLGDVLRIDDALENFLFWFPRHNLHVANGVLFEMSQVWADISMCGVHSEEDNPANTCDPPNPGEPNEPPPTWLGPDACDLFHIDCPYPDDAEPYRPSTEGGR